jgi:AcrR family transcriptional regulator
MVRSTGYETEMAGKPMQREVSARDRLIEAATQLFCRFGINAVGIDAVILEAGTAKATLYKNFGSKEGLIEAVLEREGAAWRDWFLGGLLTGTATPVERMQRIFPLLREWFAGDRFYGCPFINAIGEHDKKDDRFRQIALAHKKTVLDAIETLASEAGAADPHAVAHQIGLLIDGAIVAAMVTDDPDVAMLGEGLTRILLDRACPAPGLPRAAGALQREFGRDPEPV